MFGRMAAKSILILTAGFGDGHNAAARNLCEALEQIPITLYGGAEPHVAPAPARALAPVLEAPVAPPALWGLEPASEAAGSARGLALPPAKP